MDSVEPPRTLARHDLAPLFFPGSIAFVGASERANAPASRGLRHCRRLGFGGPLFAVNPKYQQLFDVPCVASIDALPLPVDLAVIGLPAEHATAAVAACERAGVKSVVLCSSGWSESGEQGRARERELREVLARARLRVLGPNCIGIGGAAARFSLGYNSSFEHIGFRHGKPIGVVCQSGAMLGGLLLNAEDTGVGVSSYVHVGNGLDIALEEAAEFLLARDEIRCLAMMIEGLSDGRRFVRLARTARELGKSLAVYKAGRSAVGKRAVQSHTGALAGADELFDAVCREEHVVRVDEPEDLMQVARVLATSTIGTRRGRVLVCSLSGGGASALADELARQGVAVPGLDARTVAAIDALDDPYIHAANPLDVGGSVFSNPVAAAQALEVACADPSVDGVCWVGVGAPRDERSNFLLADALARLQGCGKPAVVLPLSGTSAEAGFEVAHRLGVPVARSVRSAALLLRHAVGEADPAHSAPEADGTAPARVVPEVTAKRWLAAAGIPVVQSTFVARDEDLLARADAVGYPLVLKGVATGVAHKTEAGLVALALRDRASVAAAAARMHAPAGAVLEGYLLEPMIAGGVETVLGMRRDPQFGPMLMFGLGGTWVELMREVEFAQCPCDRAHALALVRRTRAWPLLNGFRGNAALDVEALLDALVALGKLAASADEDLFEIEINPFIVMKAGAVAVDALILRRGDAA